MSSSEALKMPGHRSRPLKGIPSSPSEMPPNRDHHSRQRSNTPRRNKYGSENMPPDDDNVKANMPLEASVSPALNKCSGKLKNGATSPALPPRPSSRQAKRKLSLESQPESEKISLDTGVKVIVRMRPLTREEQEGSQIVQKVSSNTVAVVDQQFTFDAVAGMDSSQEFDKYSCRSLTNRKAEAYPISGFPLNFSVARISRRECQVGHDLCHLSSKQVNSGVLGVCTAFLSGEPATRLRSQELQQLIAALLEFMAVCKRAIRVHSRLIGEEDQDFHTQLVNGFQSLTAELSHYIPAILSEL